MQELSQPHKHHDEHHGEQLASPPRRSLTEDLEALVQHANGQPITIGGAMEILRNRGTAMVMVLATLPLCIPGVASALAPPVGTALAIYGFQLALRRTTYVPGFLARRTLSFKTLERLVKFAVRFGRPVEHLLRPRLAGISSRPAKVVTGLALAFVGVFIALPLFIPLSNEVPALVALLLLLGLIEADGVFLIVGLVCTLVLVAVSVYLLLLVDRYGIRGGLHVVHAAMHPHQSTPAPATGPK